MTVAWFGTEQLGKGPWTLPLASENEGRKSWLVRKVLFPGLGRHSTILLGKSVVLCFFGFVLFSLDNPALTSPCSG